jgi:hypothetical protein
VQKLDDFVKNILVYLPSISQRTRSVYEGMNKVSNPLLKHLLRRRQNFQQRSIIDLSELNSSLALHLRHMPTHKINISENRSLQFGRLNLDILLNNQEKLLSALIAKQKKVLEQQATQILMQEKQRLKAKYQRSNKSKRKNKN